MELEKNFIHKNELIASAYAQATVEDDYNLPDYKPDLMKMIDAVGEVELEETKVGSQSVFVQGKLKFSVLYRGESGEKRISSLQGEIPFREKINMDGVEELDPETAEELEMGDIAVIYGDDYVDNRDPHPGVYLNAVKVDKAADGTQEDVEACQKYLDKLYEYPDQEPLPKMLLEYQDTSQVLDSVEYSWKFQDNLGSHGITSAEISLLEYPEITRIDLESPADLKLSFPGKPETLTAVRWSSDFWEAGDTAGAGEGETVALTPEERSLIIQGAEPGYVYQILMENSQGYVKFGFLTE